MAGVRRVSDLEINEDLGYQRRNWAAQRLGWAVMSAVVLAALLGLLGGSGPLSGAAAGGEGSPVSVEEYQRFVRYGAPTTLRLRLEGASGEGRARVWLDRGYLEGYEVQRVTPQPEEVVAGPERITYVFDLAEGAERVVVVFDLQPDVVGPLEGRVGTGGGASLRFRQFAYP